MRERPILMSAEMVRALLAGRKTQTRRLMKPQPVELFDMQSSRRQKCGDIFVAPDYFPTSEKTNLVIGFAEGPGTTRWMGSHNFHEAFSPYGQPGDRLWVKETHYWDRFEKLPKDKPKDFPIDFYYRAEGECCEQIPECQCGTEGKVKWRPSIFMPRWASRLTLKIKSLRVERLQDISEEDAMAEGIRMFTKDAHVFKYWPCDPCEGELKCAWADLPRTAVEAYRALWESLNGAKSWNANPWVWVIEFAPIRVHPSESVVKNSRSLEKFA